MRVLVTGARGQIGRAIASILSRRGFEVIGLGQSSASIESISGLTQYISADIASPEFAAQIVQTTLHCDAIVHSAAKIDKDLYAHSVAHTNCCGTQQVLAAAKNWGAAFIYLSSLPIIGKPRHIPITEDHPVDPPTAYHAAKLFGEYLVELACRDGVRGVSMRLTSPIGPGTPSNRIFGAFVKRAMAGESLELAGRGTRRQNYVDVRDIATGVLGALDSSFSGLINIAGAADISNHELASRCIAVLNSTSQIRFSGNPDAEEGMNWQVSIDRAKSAIGYKPEHDIDSSIHALSVEYAAGNHR